MLAGLLPPAFVIAETFDDRARAPVFAQEEALVSGAAVERRAEFASARRCAREALAAHGFPPAPLLSGPRGEPLWPDGMVGSITHCRGYRAAAVGRRDRALTVGVDAEPDEPFPMHVTGRVVRPAEERRLARLARNQPSVPWHRLLFSAKEAVFKAWYPLTRRWLGFLDVSDLVVDPASADADGCPTTESPPRWARSETRSTTR